ncbi:SRPBCC domain-containing protein [Sphingosinicella sp. CPCC 101087]|uniref:SRPBCC family protein n=1 Tax=Sphingosinicella sp. CPCC 101087 TaxID=2497754 RepID=UPI00101D2862|nr:SRPBCC domain-containing protein [Sphingosinicella sp. CPCC 101087]
MTMMSLAIAVALAAQAPALRPGLEPLAFLVGHCWQGEFPDTGERDTHCFEPVYEGQHVRDRHEVLGGSQAYRGETLYSADSSGRVAFTYWNSQGGVSRGNMRPSGDRLEFGDEAYVGPDGRRITFSTHWRRLGDDAYEAVTVSSDAPSMNRTVRYRRLAPDIAISETRAPDGSHILIHETVIGAPPAEVWSAIATAEGWRTWAVPVAWAPEPDIIETSYAPAARAGGPETIRQQILVSIPERLIAFRTIKAPDGFPHFETFRRTTGLFELGPDGQGRTRVRLTGAGYPDDEAGRELLGFFREGNRISLERLRQRFDEGPVDWSRMSREQAEEGE